VSILFYLIFEFCFLNNGAVLEFWVICQPNVMCVNLNGLAWIYFIAPLTLIGELLLLTLVRENFKDARCCFITYFQLNFTFLVNCDGITHLIMYAGAKYSRLINYQILEI